MLPKELVPNTALQSLQSYGAGNPNYSPAPQAVVTQNGLQMTNPNFSPVGGRANPMADMNVAPINVAPQSPVPASPGFSTMQEWFGGKNAAGESTMGYVPAALGIGQFATNAYFGMKNYGLAKDQLRLAKDSFNFNKDLSLTNLDNQARMVNAELEDRQRARNIANPNQAEDTASYMAKYGVRGNV